MDNVLQAIENLMARREKQITELDSSRTIILSQLHGAMKTTENTEEKGKTVREPQRRSFGENVGHNVKG